MYLKQKNLKIGKSVVENAGYGVFAEEKIKKEEIICECPLLQDTSTRDDYYFGFNGKLYLPLGFGLLINHSVTPNCKWEHKEDLLTFIATKNIEIGEELFYDYGNGYDYKKYFIN